MARVLKSWRSAQARSGSSERAVATPWRSFVLLIVVSVLGGFAEAGMLIVVVQFGLRVTESVGVSTAALPVLGDASTPTLFWIALALTTTRLVFQSAGAHLAASMSASVMKNARKDLFGAFINASWLEQADEKASEAQELMTGYVNQVATSILVTATGVSAALNVATLVISAIFLSWMTALAVVAIGAFLFWALRPMTRYGRRLAALRRDQATKYASDVASGVGVAMELRIFGVGAQFQRRIDASVDAVASLYYRATVVTGLVPVVYQTLALLMIIVALGGLSAVSPGNAVAIGAVVLLLIRAISYGQVIQSSYHQHRSIAPYVEGVQKAIERYRQAALPTEGLPMPRIDHFAFDHVSFAYRPGEPVLDDVSCAFERGDLIGIAGPSGAGKSTLVQLLLRLRVPTHGAYLVNGKPADVVALQAWYRRVAFVPQDSRLLDASVADNIRWFRDVDDDELHEASRRANIHEEILGFPDGYDTLVGEHGASVSGGQRQRISLARAFIGQPELIILDEPTSALDVRSEHAIHEALELVRGEMTMIVIAHRLSTLRTCDRIMILEQGNLQAFDDPTALLSSNAFYRQMSEMSVVDAPGSQALPEHAPPVATGEESPKE